MNVNNVLALVSKSSTIRSTLGRCISTCQGYLSTSAASARGIVPADWRRTTSDFLLNRGKATTSTPSEHSIFASHIAFFERLNHYISASQLLLPELFFKPSQLFFEEHRLRSSPANMLPDKVLAFLLASAPLLASANIFHPIGYIPSDAQIRISPPKSRFSYQNVSKYRGCEETDADGLTLSRQLQTNLWFTTTVSRACSVLN